MMKFVKIKMDVKLNVVVPNENPVEEESPLASVVLEYEDSELSSFSRKLDDSLAALKKGLLFEYEKNRDCFELKMISDNQKKEQDYINKINQLESNLKQESVSLSISNQKLEMKEKLVNNINLYIGKKERKMFMIHAFRHWMDSLDSSKGHKLAMKLAKRYYCDSLLRKIVIEWRIVVGISWKKKVEKSIHRDADFRIAVAAKESEDQIKLLQQKISTLERQLVDFQCSLKEKQNEMRSAFLRGVSALNAQAIGIFKDDDQNNEARMLLSQEMLNFQFIDIQKNDKPNFSASKSQPIFAPNRSFGKTKGLVTRHFPATPSHTNNK